MEDGNLAILVDAKTEYTKQLVNILLPYIYSGIKDIYNEAKEECLESGLMENTLAVFQKKLSCIPKWNQEVIDNKYENIVISSKCDWLEDLIMAVFVSHTRILTSINFNKSKNKVNLKIPKVDHFIHLCYIEVARCFWKNPYLFDDTINKYEVQRNRREAEKLIESQIQETIRRQLPVKNILKEYLGNEYNEIDDGEEDIENDSTYNNNLRKLVKAEIKNCSKEKLSKFSIDDDDEDEEVEANDDVDENDVEEADENDTEELNSHDAEESNLNDAKESNGNDAEESNANDTKESNANDTKESNANEADEKNMIEISNDANKDNIIEDLVKDSFIVSNEKTKLESNLLVIKESIDKLSDNETENKEVSEIIEKEVEKLELEPIDNGLNVEELNFDFDDLSELEEVYQDNASNQQALNIQNQENIKLEITESNKLGDNSLNNEAFYLDNTKKNENNKDLIKELEADRGEPAIKTIIIDTKKGTNRMLNDDNLEINEFDEGSDSEDESNRIRKKVYNRYSKNRDYSFLN